MSQTSVVASAGLVQEVVSPLGIRAFLIHDRSLPIVSLMASFRRGAALDPDELAGLSHMTAGLIDEGAGPYDSQAFRAALEDDAIRLGFDADRDAIHLELKTLSTNREKAFDLLRLALTRPRFDDEPVVRIRSQIQADLRRRSTDPDHLAGRAWHHLAFDGHPYAHSVRGTPESVAAIDVGAMREVVASRLGRDRLCVGVSGDIDADELARALDHIFGELPAIGGDIAGPPTMPRTGAVHIVPMPIPQSVVQFGHGGIGRMDPDHYPAYIVNYILGGGGFSSRLTEEIREKRGLAYSVYSYLHDTELSPLWLGGLATKNEQVALSLELLRTELRRMAEGDVDAVELKDAKTYLTGSFPLRLTSNDQVAKALLGMQVWDLGLDFLDRRNGLVEAVTLDDARRAAKRLFDQPLLVTIVGAPEGIEATA
jgi:zinc protease